MKSNKSLKLGFLAVLALFVSACVPPRVLFHETTTGDKLIQEYAITASSGEKGFYDYHLRVCNLGADGSLSACQDTLILTNVSMRGQ